MENLRTYFTLGAIILAAVTAPAAAQTAAPGKAAARDGSHDFDPLIGTWKYHLKRLKDRLAGSHEWVEFEGRGKCSPIWDGAMIEQAVFEAPGDRIEGMVVRLYNPETHQWRLYWDNRKVGEFDPPQIGEFKNGVGEFFTQDTWKGRTVLVRFQWSRLDIPSPHFEQAFSDDGGKTWEVNWITDQTRVAEDGAK
jgi:hypothetical protein